MFTYWTKRSKSHLLQGRWIKESVDQIQYWNQHLPLKDLHQLQHHVAQPLQNRVNALAIKYWKQNFTSASKYQKQRYHKNILLVTPDNITMICLEGTEHNSVPWDHFFGRVHTNTESAMRLEEKLVWVQDTCWIELYLVKTYKRLLTMERSNEVTGTEPPTHWTEQKKNRRIVPVRMTLWPPSLRFRKMYMHWQKSVA